MKKHQKLNSVNLASLQKLVHSKFSGMAPDNTIF